MMDRDRAGRSRGGTEPDGAGRGPEWGIGSGDGPGDGYRERGDHRTPDDAGRDRTSHAGKGPRNYRHDDDRLREAACEALTRAPNVDASDIVVTVENGEVTLAGRVDSRVAKRGAEDAVDRCAGVRDVHNRLRIVHETQAEAR